MSFYEECGPDSKYVRQHVYTLIYSKYNMLPELFVQRVILKRIHDDDTLSRFGSWRGWATFGLDPTLKSEILKNRCSYDLRP